MSRVALRKRLHSAEKRPPYPRIATGLMTLLLLAGCATGAGPGAGERYGLEPADAREAFERGHGQDALRYYELEAAEAEEHGASLQAAKTHTAIAFTASQIGSHQKAIRSGLRAFELLQREPPTQEILERKAYVYIALGHAYRRAGDFQEARRYYQQGFDLVKAFPPKGDFQYWYAAFSAGLGFLAHFERDKPKVALQHGNEVVGLMEEYLAEPPRNSRNARRLLAWDLWLVGRSQGSLGKLSEAEAATRRLVEISKADGQRELEVEGLALLGWLARSRGNHLEALERYHEALSLAAPMNRVHSLIYIHFGIGVSFAWQGHHDEALAAFRRSIGLMEEGRAQIREAGVRGGYLDDKQLIYKGIVRSALNLRRPVEAFDFAERARARAFLDLLGNQTVLSKGKTRVLVEDEVRLRAQLSEAKDLGGEHIEAAERSYRSFLDRVRKENLEQASLMAVDPLTLHEVQGLLPEGTTLLEYLVTEQETILWVIDRQRAKVLRLPVGRSDLVTEVRTLRQAIADQAPLDQLQSRAQALYERIVAPARPHIRGDKLLIVPHDVLHYLPFGALRTPDGRWLIEDYTLATLPSASVLKFLTEKEARAAVGALAVGNPDVGPALHLRYAEREAHAVGERFPGATVLVRQDATEAKAKVLSGEVGLLHFATHGELNEKDPLSSALLLVPDGTEDGRLEVREIFGLDLNARLVVLSACETGLGKLSKGDELVGLQRAFLYAGTPAVVTTLWKVDDRASYYLMQAFYDNLDQSGPGAALRKAQLATMRDFPHPFAWAAFGLTGVPQ